MRTPARRAFSTTFPDGVMAFDMPARLVAVSHGAAPNYESLFTVRIFVGDGQPVGSTFLGPRDGEMPRLAGANTS